MSLQPPLGLAALQTIKKLLTGCERSIKACATLLPLQLLLCLPLLSLHFEFLELGLELSTPLIAFNTLTFSYCLSLLGLMCVASPGTMIS